MLTTNDKMLHNWVFKLNRRNAFPSKIFFPIEKNSIEFKLFSHDLQEKTVFIDFVWNKNDHTARARATNQSKIWQLWWCESLAEICTNTVHELILKEKENPSSTWPLMEYVWNIDFDWKFILGFVKCTGGSCPQVELFTSWKCSLSELYSYL